MNCNEYLSMLETAAADELASPGAREHTAWCRDCDRLTRVVLERERHVRLAYDDLDSGFPAGHVAAHALATARRHRIVRNAQVIVAAMMVVAVVSIFVRGRSPTAGTVARERFRLQCLSPEQAAEVLRPVRGKTVMVTIDPGPLAMLRVEAPPEQMARIRAMLDRYDSPSTTKCAANVIVPKGRGG